MIFCVSYWAGESLKPINDHSGDCPDPDGCLAHCQLLPNLPLLTDIYLTVKARVQLTEF
jgi:hypothetical protein